MENLEQVALVAVTFTCQFRVQIWGSIWWKQAGTGEKLVLHVPNTSQNSKPSTYLFYKTKAEDVLGMNSPKSWALPQFMQC